MPIRGAGTPAGNVTTRGRDPAGAAQPANALPTDAVSGTASPDGDAAAAFDATSGTASPIAPRAGGGASAIAARAADPASPSVTADGEPKWKTPPPGVRVVPNETGRGAWIEKWQSPTTGKWVHNYTQAYMEARADKKFVKNKRFGDIVGDIRAQVGKDLLRNGTKKQQCALVVALIDQAYFRVGNEESDDNGVYGVTTLLQRHVTFGADGQVEFEYVGKKSVEQHRVVVDKQIAKVLKRLHAKAGSADGRMFQHNGNVIDAGDVNAYLKKFGVTAKQFRTFHATRLMKDKLSAHAGAPKAEREAIVAAAFEEVAALLGHTPAVCRGSYVDPTVVERFEKKGKL